MSDWRSEFENERDERQESKRGIKGGAEEGSKLLRILSELQPGAVYLAD